MQGRRKAGAYVVESEGAPRDSLDTRVTSKWAHVAEIPHDQVSLRYRAGANKRPLKNFRWIVSSVVW